jgi:DNA-binding LacI/PurR family transcriptional regulator
MTDQVALAAHAHLQKRGKQLARDISLAGFDDTLAGFEVGLTSYDFNVPAAVHAVLGHIFASRQGKRRKEPLFTEIPGTIMTRSSSGARL